MSKSRIYKIPKEFKNNSSLKSSDIKINGSAIQTDTANLDNLVVIDTKDKFDIDILILTKLLYCLLPKCGLYE